jgi:type I restriction enzyme, S subunit
MKYPGYEKYEESEVKWIGEIPVLWETKRLKFLTTESLKYGANISAELDDIDLPRYIRITDIDSDGNLKEETFRSIEYHQAIPYFLKEGDILFARSGATVGKTFIYKKSWGICAYAGYLIKSSINENKYDSRYIYYYSKTHGYQKWVESVTIQATIQNVSAEKYASLRLPIPSLQEQQSIANFLDKETSRLDALIAKKQQLIETLKEKRIAIISHAVTKGLNPDVPMKDSGIEWLGEVPEHWEEKTLKFVSTLNDETLSETTDPEYEIKYVDIGSIDQNKGIIKKESYIFDEAPSRARRKVINGDIIVSTVRTYLRAIAPVINPEENLIVSTGFAVVRPRKITSDYLSFLLRSKYFVEKVVSLSVGVSYPAINASVLGSIKIPIPGEDEQIQISNYVFQETQNIDKIIGLTEKHIDKLMEYKTALISAAVTGKIKVPEQA